MVPDRWLLPVAGGLFYFALKNAFLGCFKPFSARSYIIYQLGNKNGLNRIFGKNNFRGKLVKKSRKKSANFFSLKINHLQRLSKIIEKKVHQSIASLKKGCKFAASNNKEITN